MPDPLRERFGVPRPTGDLPHDAAAFLCFYGFGDTAAHCARVAHEAAALAARFGEDQHAAACAGWLHDISAVIPDRERAETAYKLGLEVLPEERAYPMIVHQKLSAVMAEQLFAVEDRAILSAISCHTTLKQGASPLDKVVFVADKVRWDGKGEPPYLGDLVEALRRSLDAACLCYLEYLWRRRDQLKVVHPWFLAAHAELEARVRQGDQ